jgi:hypothetical protein
MQQIITRLYFTSKRQAKLIRWSYRRFRTARRWGNNRLKSMPSVLGNAMPKSGSHLIIQVLQGLTRLGPFVNPGFPPVNRSEDNRKLSPSEILANISRMKAGDIAYGYIGARDPYLPVLVQPGRAMVFVYRDPRDMAVSQVFYATEMNPRHGMNEYYNKKLSNMEQRLNAVIQGVDEPGFEMISIKERWDSYLGWLSTPEALCLRFEDLINNRQSAFNQLLDYLEVRGFTNQPQRHHALQILNEAIVPRKSGTFRKAKPGNWREYFTETNIILFKETCADLLIRLGYEKDGDWA